jgi:hypothetical protein
VDCVDSDRCGGRVTLRTRASYFVPATDTVDAKVGGWERVAQTCGCRCSAEDEGDLYDRADQASGRA